MATNFDSWPRRSQIGPHIARRKYNTLDDFFPNICLGIGPLTAFHKAFHIDEELLQEPKEV